MTLGGAWREYDAATQATLEAAWAGGQSAVEVKLRGTVYVISLTGEMVQQQKDDPARWRAVRRV